MSEYTMLGIRISAEKDTLRLSLGRQGRAVLHAFIGFSFVVAAPFAVPALTNSHNPNAPILLLFSLTLLSMFVAMAFADFGFSSIVFDRKADRIEQGGSFIGNFGSVCSIFIETRQTEEDRDYYKVFLVLSGPRPDWDDCIDCTVGDSFERAEAITFANLIADFLGVEVVDGNATLCIMIANGKPSLARHRPISKAKPPNHARDVDMEW